MITVNDVVAIGPPIAPLPASTHEASVVDISGADSDELRWRQWQAKGRADAVRFRGRLQTVLLDVTAVIAVAGAVWLAFLV